MICPASSQLRAWVMLAAAAFGLAACSPHLVRPELSLVSIKLQEAQLLEQHFLVHLRVQNPNGVRIPIRGISYRMEVGGQDFGTGQSAKEFTVPAHGEAEFDMIVTTNLATTLPRILGRLGHGAEPLDYRLVGKVETGITFLSSIPFDERGELPLH